MNDETANVNQVSFETQISEQTVLEHQSYKQLLEKFTQEEQNSKDLHNKWLLAQADLENLRRRTEKEIIQTSKYAIEKFASEVIITVDNLERGLSAKISDNADLKDFCTGIKLTLKFLLETLQKFDIIPIDPNGEIFDPEKHTAITTKEDRLAESGIVLEVIQKGYWLKDRLLRPALVVVAK
jgi:molecular chaperone GrpE